MSIRVSDIVRVVDKAMKDPSDGSGIGEWANLAPNVTANRVVFWDYIF